MVALIAPSARLLAFFLAFGGGSAASPVAGPAAACPAVDAPSARAPRVRAFIDPATGRLRPPTVDELRRIAEERLAARQASPPRVFVVVEHPDGMKSVDLGDAFLFDVKVETREDGASRIVCVPPSNLPANPLQ
jgi:hypothetical protein